MTNTKEDKVETRDMSFIEYVGVILFLFALLFSLGGIIGLLIFVITSDAFAFIKLLIIGGICMLLACFILTLNFDDGEHTK